MIGAKRILMPDSDTKLLTRYKKGEIEALEELVSRHGTMLMSYVSRHAKGSSDADEVFQETWLRVIKSFNSFKDKNFCGWLVRIARNIVIDRSRKKKPDSSLDEAYDDGSPVRVAVSTWNDASKNVANKELDVRIRASVDCLPIEQKDVFLMRMQADLSFKEIAKIQKVSINTALARMQYAVNRLREELADEYLNLG